VSADSEQVAQIRATYTAPQWYSVGVPMGPNQATRDDVLFLLGALAAAEAARDRALEDRYELQECLLRQKGTIDWQFGKIKAAEQRASRLAALEQAARAWHRHRAIACDPQTPPDVWWANTSPLVQAERALADTVQALDPAPATP